MRRATVVLERAEKGIDGNILRADQVGVGEAAAASTVADQIMALAIESAGDVRC